MQIHVLQGLNLKNDMTTVVAEMKTVKPDLLEFFKQLHPVFMKEYKIEDGKTLNVQTHLPYLWKNEEFLRPIEQHSAGTLSYEDAEDKMLEVAKTFVSSMSTVPILHAAHELGYETYQFFVNEGISDILRFNRIYSVGIGREQHTIYSAGSSKDSSHGVKIQRDKAFTNQIIEKMGLPIAKWAIVESREELAEATEKVGYPLVLKPVGLTAGHGVHIGMKNLEELEEAWDRTHEYYDNEMKYPGSKSKWQKKIIIQQVLKGEDYRILVVNGKFEVGTHRLQARVAGDGRKSVAELIEEENKNPARDMRLPTHTLKQIVIDKDLKKVLSKQDLSIDYVPKKGEDVRVRDVASMSQGGITADVTEKVHPQIRLMCESIAKTIHVHVLGVDVLCQNISEPLTLENGGIIEMNTMPEMYLNIYPVIGKEYPEVPKNTILGLVGGTDRTQRVVVIGDIKQPTVNAHVRKELKDINHIGYLRGGTVFFDEKQVNTGLAINKAVLSLKRNGLLDTIILHYKEVEDVERNGFGFDEIDLLITTKQEFQKVHTVVKNYTEEKLIHNIVKV